MEVIMLTKQGFEYCIHLILLNLPKFAQMVAIVFVTMETGGLAENHSIYFLLSKTHSTVWAEKITLTMHIKTKSYQAAMSHL